MSRSNQEIAASAIIAGNLKFVPAANANGTSYDTFQFKVHDGTAYSLSSYTITVDVTPINDAPTAGNDSYDVKENSTLTVSERGVLLNDTDSDGDLLTAVMVTTPNHGTLLLHSDGSFIYTPETAYHGLDLFTYQASDGLAVSQPVTVSIVVNPTAQKFVDGWPYDQPCPGCGGLEASGRNADDKREFVAGLQGDRFRRDKTYIGSAGRQRT